ncbi:MAG: C10 family peptidase [Bacteroidales bacterium]|nr:C10 family peptidase [Bacteroidales bacterium]
MKKIIILLSALLTSFMSIAQQIHEDDAVRAAINILRSTQNSTPTPITELFAVRCNDNGDTIMYEVTMDNDLSVFVSGNRRIKPILGVCENYGSSILQNIDRIPDGLKYMLDIYCNQIEYAFGTDSSMLIADSRWVDAVRGNLPTVDTIVNKLLSTQWGQTQSNDGNDPIAYNYYMPQGVCTPGSHCPAGCVAVAMGQVINYWKSPSIFVDNLNFDWCNAPDALYSVSANYETERNTISFLLYRCGLSVDMDYCSNGSCSGSGAYTSTIADVLPTNFGYSSDAVYRTRSGCTDSEWLNYIKSNLNNGWPVIYRGSSTQGGHAFVCDGYLSDNRFSFNWGWNGLFNNNWLSLDNLAPINTIVFNDQGGVFNIHPVNTDFNYCDFSLQLYSHYDFYYNFVQNTTPPPYYNVPSNATHLTSVPEQYNASWRTIPSGVTASYEAHSSVTLVPGFHAENGSEFTVSINSCPICENTQRDMSPRFGKHVPISESCPAHNQCKSTKECVKLKVYPNPTDGMVTVEYVLQEDSYVKTTVYDMTGSIRQTLGQGKRNKGFVTEKFDMSNMRNGTYIVSVSVNGNVYTNKVIKQ